MHKGAKATAEGFLSKEDVFDEYAYRDLSGKKEHSHKEGELSYLVQQPNGVEFDEEIEEFEDFEDKVG